jgi:hypothetical protein
VQRVQVRPDSELNLQGLVTKSKLLLDTSQHTEDIREELSITLDKLRRDRMIKEDHDVIAHFLTRLFEHTGYQLRASHRFDAATRIEFVLCVPVTWSRKACRIMQTAMTTAIRSSRIYRLPTNNVDNLFIVSEPEAAATAVLAGKRDVRVGRSFLRLCEVADLDKVGDTFVLLDAGGGTVDAITYKVDESTPLRLEQEAVPPSGEPSPAPACLSFALTYFTSAALCGSSYLNQNFKKLLWERLWDEKYLEVGDVTIGGIINSLAVDFESIYKRHYDGALPKAIKLFVQNLVADDSKRFTSGRVWIMQ